MIFEQPHFESRSIFSCAKTQVCVKIALWNLSHGLVFSQSNNYFCWIWSHYSRMKITFLRAFLQATRVYLLKNVLQPGVCQQLQSVLTPFSVINWKAKDILPSLSGLPVVRMMWESKWELQNPRVKRRKCYARASPESLPRTQKQFSTQWSLKRAAKKFNNLTYWAGYKQISSTTKATFGQFLRPFFLEICSLFLDWPLCFVKAWYNLLHEAISLRNAIKLLQSIQQLLL